MRIILVDDSAIIRAGLARMLAADGHDIADTLDRAERLPASIAAHNPDAVVLDIRLPPTHSNEGLQAAASIRPRYPTLGILVLSQYIVPEYATRLLSAGEQYTGYLLKDRVLEPRTLSEALETIQDGGTVVDEALITVLLRARQADLPLQQLTQRELEVLQLMAQGLSDKGIASALVISGHTVGTHVKHIFTKLELPEDHTDNRRVLAVLEYLQATRAR